jgi:putative membrane protein
VSVEDLPALNAGLNGLATLLLTAGFIAIWRQAKVVHGWCMASAFGVSVIFLITYVLHKILVQGVHTPFGGEGWIRGVYYGMLISHIILAIVIVPLIIGTLWFVIRRDFATHRRWARITFPLWYYVSITGVLVYFFLYQWFPAG